LPKGNKTILAGAILFAIAVFSIAAYIVTGFPDFSCGCPIRVTIIISTIASPIIIVVAILLIRKGRREKKP